MQKNRKPIEIKISTVVAISALLHESAPAEIDKALREMTGGASDFFEDEFAVLDIASLPAGAEIDWPALIAVFKTYRLNAVAVRHAPPEMHAGIVAHGLSIADGAVKAPPAEPEAAESRPAAPARATAAAPAPATAPPQQQTQTQSTMIIDTPVRAGTRIYARGADLVVMAAVNNGAEIIADGSIHVYAPLRGRALAGASGNADARIFTTSMEAELISIAGVYRTFEKDLPPELANKPVQVRLSGDRLDMLAIKNT
ncbi:septum site-determining protein MinC [Oxalobacteraceae bacterium CAVE-383]|nr:septum site-determining protein MinC [Oxalobacteraceae bacterium CAVE-383]